MESCAGDCSSLLEHGRYLVFAAKQIDLVWFGFACGNSSHEHFGSNTRKIGSQPAIAAMNRVLSFWFLIV